MRLTTRLMNLPLLLALFALSFATACETAQVDEPSNDSDTTITIAQEVIEVAAEGGNYTISYELLNGINGIEPVVVSEVDWAKGVCNNGIIALSITANNSSESRETTLSVRYPNISPSPTITVTQAGDNREHFTFTVGEMTSTSCETTVTPADSEMVYIVYMSEVTYFEQMGIATTEQLFEDDYGYFVGFAKEYLTDENMHLLKEFMLMNSLAFEGESNVVWSGMMPSREYILYAYGIEFSEDGKDYSLATPITYHSIVLPENTLATVVMVDTFTEPTLSAVPPIELK